MKNHEVSSEEFQKVVDDVWSTDLLVLSQAGGGFHKRLFYNPRYQNWVLVVRRTGEEESRDSFYTSEEARLAYNEARP